MLDCAESFQSSETTECWGDIEDCVLREVAAALLLVHVDGEEQLRLLDAVAVGHQTQIRQRGRWFHYEVHHVKLIN